MKDNLAAVIRKLISPSMRYEMRQASSWLRDILGRACVWRWEIARFRLQKDSPYEILYIGRKQQREMAKLLIGGKNTSVTDGEPKPAESNHVVVVSEVRTPGTLSIPLYLSAVVPLGRSIEDITAKYDGELRRNIRKNRPHYHMRPALLDEEIEKADREMLRPYAQARHPRCAISHRGSVQDRQDCRAARPDHAG